MNKHSSKHNSETGADRAAGATRAARPGPRVLFFSGGTALKETAKELARQKQLCAYLVTPFDSGGSSAALRHAFAMPAVGDMRARILALADDEEPGAREACTLFSYRLPHCHTLKKNRTELTNLARGRHPLMRLIAEPANSIIREHLSWLVMRLPDTFALSGASVGNLFIASGYLRNNRRIAPVAALLSRLVHARGIVRTTVEKTAHLAVRLQSGELIIGQHKFTGKGEGCIASPISEIWLTESEASATAVAADIAPRTVRLIEKSQSICYPVGSFYSSVVANLLPGGVGRAVAACRGAKVFVPNPGHDPELVGHTLSMQVERILEPLLHDAPAAAPADVLTHVLVDSINGRYPGGIPEAMLRAHGIQLIDTPLVNEGHAPYMHPRLLADAVLRATRPAGV